jgi:hypothetical protein
MLSGITSPRARPGKPTFIVFATMVADPHSFIRIRIQHLRLNTNPDPGFHDQKIEKITAEKKIVKDKKTTVYLSLGLHKERPSYRRSLQISKEAIQHFKT